MKEFTFTPRIQRLYELEAHSRIKLNFISRLYKYMQAQGIEKIRVPSIGGRFLDLQALHKAVRDFGGYHKIARDNLWPVVTERLGYSSKLAHAVRTNYEKLLLNFDELVSSSKTSKPYNVNGTSCSKRLRHSSSSEVDSIDFSRNKELRNLRFFGPGPKAAVPSSGQSKAPNEEHAAHFNADMFSCRACGHGDNEASLLVCATDSCQACYHLYCLKPPLRSVPNCQWKCPDCIRALCSKPPDPYGFPQSSKAYSLHEFGVMADEFKSTYFGRPCTEVPCSVVEQEFWRILQEYNDDVVVEYGADIHSSSQGSGFPTADRLQNLVGTVQQLEDAKMYAVSPWNLNILPLLDRSILRFIKGNIDGMKIPWCYVGMVFSSFCWHIEDHWSYSINFNHWGEPKTWYGVPRPHAEDFERAMRKHAPELFEQAPDLLHHITTNMNPNILQAEGVPIYRTDQRCGEFVVTFPRAYHSGFNQGFNFAEAVNICLPDWLPIGRSCVKHYAQMRRHCVFSNDELLCTLAEVATGRVPAEDVLLVTNPYFPPGATKPRLPTGCSTAGLDISAVAIVHQEFSVLLSEERRLRQIVLNLGVVRQEKVRFDELHDDVRVCDACLTTLFLSGISCPCASTVQSPVKPSDERENVISNGKKRAFPSAADSAKDTVNLDTSSDECERTRRFTVCLNHPVELCSNCPPVTWTLKYHHTIEELEELDRSLGLCLKNFYAWKQPLSRFLKKIEPNGADESTASTDPVKVESDSNDNCTVDTQTMSISELRSKLNAGRACGYHTDDVFIQAEALLTRADHLVGICTSVRAGMCTFIDAQKKSEESQKSSCNTVRFQFRVPANFNLPSTTHSQTPDSLRQTSNVAHVLLQHEVDVNNPREIDLVRLTEACRQLHHVNIMDDPDVHFIAEFLQHLTDWRQRIRNCVSSICQFALTNATRSLTTHCSTVLRTPTSMVSESPKSKSDPLVEITNDEHVFILLSELLRDLYKEFPGFAPRIAEWNSLHLIRKSFKWLCICQRQLDEKHDHRWTLPRLRHHSITGEDLLSQLSAASTASLTPSTKSASGVSLPNNTGLNSSVSSVDPTIAPISRLLRAKMHTALGQLSQLVVQVESLVSILNETLSATGSLSYLRLACVLDQLRSLKVTHLINWGEEDIEVPDDTKLQTDLEGELIQQMPSDTDALRPSGVVDELRRTFLDRLTLITKSTELLTPLTSRPQLNEGVVLLSLGLLLGSLPSPAGTHTRLCKHLATSGDVDVVLSNSLSQLDNLVSTTRVALNRLHLEVLGAECVDEADGNIALIKRLLPFFPHSDRNDICLQDFMKAYERSPMESVKVYGDFAQDADASFLTLMRTALNDGRLCGVCCQRFAADVTVETSPADCSFCTCLPTGLPLPEDTLRKLAPVWTVDCSAHNSAPLGTPHAVAFQGCLMRFDRWLDEVDYLLRSNLNIIASIRTRLDYSVLSSLPRRFHSLSVDISSVSVDGPTELNCTDLVSEFRGKIAAGIASSINLDPYLAFLTAVISTLRLPTVSS
ncbi:unnamed protein product [Dicrocoelium dendriticum]|nr:unnamed protein product [Dicrocoelium dendriticum]